MKISVVVTTYNRPAALSLVLRALLAQQRLPDEILIADDGSTEETRAAIQTLARTSSVPMLHLWQEDQGFRAAAARNLSVAAAQGDLIVFLDGDCVPRPDFVAQHQCLAEPGQFVAGSRVLLNPAFTEQVVSQQPPLHQWGRLTWLLHRIQGHANRWWPLCHLPGQTWRKSQPMRWQSARTCNMAVWREDLLAVNGFDEQYQGWGHEDADLAVRLIRQGVHYKNGRFATTVLHLWHPENDRSQLPENVAKLEKILNSSLTQAAQGLNRYSPPMVAQALQARA